MPSTNPPTIRDTVRSRMAERDLSAYAVAKLTRGADGKPVVSADHVAAYVAGTKDMTSERLDAVFRVLGLRVTANGGTPRRG